MRKMGDKQKYLYSMAENIVDGYNSGQTLRWLASMYNTSTGSIRTLLIHEGVTLRKPGRPIKEK